MRKLFITTSISLTAIFLGVLILLATVGIKTNKFNNLINEKVNDINSKIKLNLNEINFKLNLSNLEFKVITIDPTISINDKEIYLENINFDISIFEFLKNENTISKISIETKENNINQLVNFINEYEFNLARNLMLKQIKKGKVKTSIDIIFDQNKPNQLKYFANGSINNAEVKLTNNLEANNIKFDFKIDQDTINLKDIKLLFDKISVTSDEININKASNQFEINGKLKTKKTKINLNNYSKIIDSKFDILDDLPVNLSSENKVYFKINNKFIITDLKIETKLKFDELFTKSKYQDFIYLKNGNVLIDYYEKELNINLDSKFLFKKDKYNNIESNNLFKLVYKNTEILMQ